MGPANQPLVSCIMPTYNRRQFVPHAIRYFLRQDYENKELIIVDDGTDAVADLIPATDNIRYLRLNEKISLGAKLNLACDHARGNIIANWDDDDWYAARRLRYQVDALNNGNIDVCGINHLLYYDLCTHQAYQYVYPSSERTWLLGSSLCYTRERWQQNPFVDINVGMDGLFVWSTPPERVKVLPDTTISVHMIHQHNVSPKKTSDSWWHQYPVSEIQKIILGDWHCYHNNGTMQQPQPATVVQPGPPAIIASTQRPFTNVFACLIHENEDCVIDLVRNLHYHDPASIILLYNGGENKRLIQQRFLLEQLGAILHPDPVPVKHGYLHPFALKCMEFALDNFSFDALTIVDSDQLCLRSGYSARLEQFLASRPHAGMLSSMPERVGEDNKKVYTAIQAFEEYDLWKPLLHSFPGGEQHFVHWTFWPSTVFTRNACRDLLQLFNENQLLQAIMQRTKIWATEEIILPTLTRLLGYEIVQNPCSYDFVKYRETYSPQDVQQAMSRADAFWIHPVQRKYDEPLRKQIRQQCHHYVPLQRQSAPADCVDADLFLPLSLVNSLKKIEGWLSDREADLLMGITLKALADTSIAHHLVEIGSYHGKSTVLLGSVVKACCPGAKVYAIDTHDGQLGAADQGIQFYPPSFEQFKKNIANAGLQGIVEPIKDKSYHVTWQKNISLLLIDGLHDYPNTARDFWHFAGWIVPGGYVCFHDCAEYYPGVQAFVRELAAGGAWRIVCQADSLAALQKL